MSSSGDRVASQGNEVEDIQQVLDLSQWRERRGLAAPSETVQGSLRTVWDTVTRLRTNARSEIRGLDDTSYLVARAVPEDIQQRGPATLKAALRRGARVRQVTSRAGLLADQELGAIVHRAGGEARVIDRLPLKLSIIDRRIAMLPIDFAVLAGGFRVIRDPEVVAALVRVHERLWSMGEEPTGIERDLPPPHLARVVPALASGYTDDVAAAKLGLSPRTYSRRVAELLRILGTTTRFQAGVEAARRGWL